MKLLTGLFIVFAGVFCFISSTFGQYVTIMGNTTVAQNTSAYYNTSWNPYQPSSYEEWNWYPKGNNSLSSHNASSAQVYWVDVGTHYLEYELITWDNYYWDDLAVTVTGSGPATPSTTFTLQSNCGNTLVSRNASPPSTAYWYWQTSSTGQSTALGYASSITRTATGALYLRARLKTSPFTWSSTSLSAGTINVKPAVTAAPTVQNASRCGAGSLTLSGTPGANANTLRWYLTENGGSPFYTGTSRTETFPGSVTYYVASFHSTNFCESTLRTAVTATIHAPDPSVTFALDPSTCSPRNLSYTYSAGPPPGVVWYWQTAASGESTSNSTTSFSVYTAQNYYVRAYHSSTGCWSTGAPSYNVSTVTDLPASPPNPISPVACGSRILSKSGTPESGVSWYWQGTNANGTDYTSSIATGANYSTNTSGTFYIRARNSSGCWSENSASLYVDVVEYPDPPVFPAVSANTCGPKTWTKADAPTGVTYYWQGSNADTYDAISPIANSAAFTVSDAGTYYVRAKKDGTSCWSTSTPFSKIVDPVDVVLTSYGPNVTLVQSTHSITLSADGGGFTIPAGSTFTAKIAITSECNDLVNWSESIVYDQNETPITRSKSYYDGLGKPLLDESKDYMSKKVFASQPLYNSYGMAVGSTLSAPILEHDFIFKKNFAQNEGNAPYTDSDFDLRTNTAQPGEINYPKPMGEQPGTVGWYYSASNNLEPRTPVTDFPYSRSFAPEGPDPTTSKSAGSGDAHRMGSGHEI